MKMKYVLALASLMIASPVLAAFDEADREKIRTAFDALFADIREGNYGNILSTMPPKVLNKMAEQMGTNTEALKSIVAEQVKGAMAQIEIKDVSYDLEGAAIGTSKSGRDYAIISTRTVMEFGDQKIEGISPSLALEDEGEWYIVRIEGPQHAALIGAVYPDLGDLKYPEAIMKPVE